MLLSSCNINLFSLYSQNFLFPEALILPLSFHTHFTFPAQNSITRFLCIIFFNIFLSFCLPLWSLISCTCSSDFLHFSFHYHNLLCFCRTADPSFWLVFWATYIKNLCVVSFPLYLPKLYLTSHLFVIELWFPFITNIVVRVIIIFMFPLQFTILCYNSSL